MYEIRASVPLWAQQTFEESLMGLSVSKKLKTKAAKCYQTLNLLDKPVNGYASENLPKTEEGKTGVKITYSEIFHELLTQGVFSPTAYLVRLIELFIAQEDSVEKLNGFIARGMRTLTSLLREPDFALSITEYLRAYDPNVQASLNSRQDSGDHTDVLLYFNNHVYRIWLFQFSSRGIPHDIERLSGKRGELPEGTHVLCPLHTELAIEYDKLYHKKKNTEYKLKKCNDDLSSCSVRAVSKRNSLIQRIKNYESVIQKIDDNIGPLKEMSSAELDIVEGWYFYSPSYVKRIGKMIISLNECIEYKEVIEILTGPERFLSEPKIFRK